MDKVTDPGLKVANVLALAISREFPEFKYVTGFISLRAAESHDSGDAVALLHVSADRFDELLGDHELVIEQHGRTDDRHSFINEHGVMVYCLKPWPGRDGQ